MEAFAEQDNRVRIPDGTAAVCAYGGSYDESQSLGNWEDRITAKASTSQKTYAMAFLRFLRVMGSALSQKNGCGTCIGCRSLFVF